MKGAFYRVKSMLLRMQSDYMNNTLLSVDKYSELFHCGKPYKEDFEFVGTCQAIDTAFVIEYMRKQNKRKHKSNRQKAFNYISDELQRLSDYGLKYGFTIDFTVNIAQDKED